MKPAGVAIGSALALAMGEGEVDREQAQPISPPTTPITQSCHLIIGATLSWGAPSVDGEGGCVP